MPEIRLDDTICAIATASGEAALSIVRLSGKDAHRIADKVFRAKSGKKLSHAQAFTIHYGHIADDRIIVDECLVSVFRKPKSFTTEDMIEFSTHGGAQAAREVLKHCIKAGARLAEPGEFTRRAFLNGRIDLTQAEAVTDIIRSASERSLREAAGQLDGKLSKKINDIKNHVLKVLAHMEAYVDFPEEDHEVFTNQEFKSGLSEIRSDLEILLASFSSGKVLRDGVLCVLVGKPNVGKSALLNALLNEDRAIVTPVPGTTRDTLEEGVVWDGVSVRLVDTAGLGVPKDELDQLGMARTRQYLARADLFLWVLDSASPITDDDVEMVRAVRPKPFVAVFNKCDLPCRIDQEKIARESKPVSFVPCSALEGTGLEELKKKVTRYFLESESKTENVHLTRERHRQAVEEALAHILRAEDAFQKQSSLEFIASDLRGALRALGELVGEIYTDDLLDVIFREFCVGK